MTKTLNKITAGQKAKSNLTKRKAPDWDNVDRGYRYLTQDMGLDHDSTVALLANVVEESQGNYQAVQKNGGGKGLIQWDGRPAPKGRYEQWGSIWGSVAKKANRYDPVSKETKNYWKSVNGVNGEQLRQKFNNPNTSIIDKTRIYAESYLRPGKPRHEDRKLSALQLDSIYNPKIKNRIVVRQKGGFLNSQQQMLNSGMNVLSGVFNNFLKTKRENQMLKQQKQLANAQYKQQIADLKLQKAQEAKSFADQYMAQKQQEFANGGPENASSVVANYLANQNMGTELAQLERQRQADNKAYNDRLFGNKLNSAMGILQGIGSQAFQLRQKYK